MCDVTDIFTANVCSVQACSVLWLVLAFIGKTMNSLELRKQLLRKTIRWQSTQVHTICLGSVHDDNYYYTVNRHLNHADAQRHCQTLGAAIVSIHSAEENSFLNDLNTRGSQYRTELGIFRDRWIGFVTVGGGCSCVGVDQTACETCRSSWTWIDGSPNSFRKFAPRHPMSGSTACARMLRDGQWTDTGCDLEIKSICKGTYSSRIYDMCVTS